MDQVLPSALNDDGRAMSKDAPKKPKDPNADEDEAAEDLKQVVRDDIDEQRALLEKLRRRLN